VGFKAVFRAAAGVRDSQLAMPDVGIATASEYFNWLNIFVNSIKVPLIVTLMMATAVLCSLYRTTRID